ncbi:MAG: hypothetical protein LN413_04800 [Candidatus Thermoplasmatota archaeon]|nr:hypothetical protein [Candidatus Thermoplasmatota archaeon]
MSEKTLGVIGGVRSGRRHWSLVVTSERIIVANVGKAGLGAAFEVGGILMAKARAKRRTEKLSQQAPEAVLGAHKLNYDIPYAEVQSARMDDPDIVATGTLEMETATGKEAFSLTDEEGYPEHADLLRTALGETLQFD